MKQPEVYLFYRFDAGQPPASEPVDDPGFAMELWKPSFRTPWPRGASANRRLHFLFRTLLHLTRMFASRDSGAMVLYEGMQLVHYSAFTPCYWRFPFLAPGDLQVGDTWTQPSYRGRGLARRALRGLLKLLAQPGRSIWYVVEDVNRPSIRVAEDCGFRLAGIGRRVERMRGFDFYQITVAK
jgi:RimJ/RimL family protein N-acetyltransferase